MKTKKIETVKELKEYLNSLPEEMELYSFCHDDSIIHGSLASIQRVKDNEIIKRPSKKTINAKKVLFIY